MARYVAAVLLAPFPIVLFALIQNPSVPASAVQASEAVLRSTRGAIPDVSWAPAADACACAQAYDAGGMAAGFTCDCTNIPNEAAIVCYQCDGLANVGSCGYLTDPIFTYEPTNGTGDCSASVLLAGVCTDGACPDPVDTQLFCDQTYPICIEESQ
jgi:hypothetical protein